MNYGNNQDQAVREANGRQWAWSSRKGSLERWWEGRRRVHVPGFLIPRKMALC